jgi:hypothetical protein
VLHQLVDVETFFRLRFFVAVAAVVAAVDAVVAPVDAEM